MRGAEFSLAGILRTLAAEDEDGINSLILNRAACVVDTILPHDPNVLVIDRGLLRQIDPAAVKQ